MFEKRINWWEVVIGALFIILGCLTFAYSGVAFKTFVIGYGVVAMVAGILHILGYFKLNKVGIASGITLVTGILDLIVGIMFLTNVGAGELTIALLFPIWFIMSCVSQIAKLGLVKSVSSTLYWVILIFNIIGISIGALLIFNPIVSAISVVYLVGFYLIISGVSSLALGFSGYGGDPL